MVTYVTDKRVKFDYNIKMKNLDIFPFFKMLSSDEQQEFMELLQQPYSASKGTILHYQGDTCTNTLLLVKGEVRLYSQTDSFSEELTLYTLRAGEQCLSKIMSELKDASLIPSAVAETDVEGYMVERDRIDAFIAKVPIYQDFILTLYAKKIVELTQAMQHIKFKNLDERIMDFLQLQGSSQITITHNLLAQKMNTSRSVVSRVLKKLEERGRVRLFRGVIEVLKN